MVAAINQQGFAFILGISKLFICFLELSKVNISKIWSLEAACWCSFHSTWISTSVQPPISVYVNGDYLVTLFFVVGVWFKGLLCLLMAISCYGV